METASRHPHDSSAAERGRSEVVNLGVHSDLIERPSSV